MDEEERRGGRIGLLVDMVTGRVGMEPSKNITLSLSLSLANDGSCNQRKHHKRSYHTLPSCEKYRSPIIKKYNKL